MGRHRVHEFCVEDCIVLFVQELVRAGLLKRPPGFSLEGGAGELHFRFSLQNKPWLVLDMEWRAGSTESCFEEVHLIMQPCFRGYRCRFVCPSCTQKAGCLYLPPFQNRLLCRGCYSLTYRSSRERYSALDALSKDVVKMSEFLQSRDRRKELLALRALTRRLTRLKSRSRISMEGG